MSAICGGCNVAINDQYMFHVLDKTWHADCLCCADCKVPQTETCFFRDGMILCRNDFTSRFGTRCAGCSNILKRDDFVRRARNLIFHVDCFKCFQCQKTLNTGEQLYIIEDSKFVCQVDFDLMTQQQQQSLVPTSIQNIPPHHHQPQTQQQQHPPQSSSEECNSIDEIDDELHDGDADTSPSIGSFANGAPGSGGEDDNQLGKGGSDDCSLATKRRGPRTTIKHKQLETLRAAFAATPKPTRHMREQLAAETGLNMRVIQVWFQNRRSKERRLKQSRSAIGYRQPRRNRQTALRPEDMNNVFCDIMEPMQNGDPSAASVAAAFYNNAAAAAAAGGFVNQAGQQQQLPPPGFFAAAAAAAAVSTAGGVPCSTADLYGSTAQQATAPNHQQTLEAISLANLDAGIPGHLPSQTTSQPSAYELDAAFAAAVQQSTADYLVGGGGGVHVSLEEALLQSSASCIGGGAPGGGLSLAGPVW